jgi:F0F1-type ATP synthase membrane subunit c/vacuolar-type H+-ATPase subunit K
MAASGLAPLSYNSRAAITGNPSALTETLTLAAVTTSQAGNYDCVVTSPAGSITSAGALLTVMKAPATITLGALTQTYDGTPHQVTATTLPTGLAVTLTYNGDATAPINAGSYAVAATINDADYFGSATGTLVVTPATATITLGGLSHIYDSFPHAVTAASVPAGLAVTLTYNGSASAPANSGSYAINAVVANPNYIGSATGTLVISPAPATITLAPLQL